MHSAKSFALCFCGGGTLPFTCSPSGEITELIKLDKEYKLYRAGMKSRAAAVLQAMHPSVSNILRHEI